MPGPHAGSGLYVRAGFHTYGFRREVGRGRSDQVTTDSERGRGLFLIKALSDNVRMQSTPRHGSLIHFEKSFALAGGPVTP